MNTDFNNELTLPSPTETPKDKRRWQIHRLQANQTTNHRSSLPTPHTQAIRST